MDHHPAGAEAVAETPFSISHFVNTLKAYRPVVALAMIGIAVVYMILAVGVYLLSQAERTTTVTFRLQFKGASVGQYPNGLHFAATDLIATPILLKVYQDNQLNRFLAFDSFSNSVFVLEANSAFEKLATEYQGRLSDPKLTPMDRDRIEREFELKAASIARDEFSLNYAQQDATSRIPESTVRRVLLDIIKVWSAYVVRDRHVLEVDISPMSAAMLENSPGDPNDLIIQIQILRSKIIRAMVYVNSLVKEPGAAMARTSSAFSLEDVRVGLEDLLRYRIEPLMGNVRSSGLVSDMSGTIGFLESQLAHDQRELTSRQSYAESLRMSIATLDSKIAPDSQLARKATTPQTGQPNSSGETLMPQLGDSFLDRLVDLTTKAQDANMRQRLVEQYLSALQQTVPFQDAVAYDTRVLEEVRASSTGTARQKDRGAVVAEIEEVKAATRALVVKANELHQTISSAIVPSSELITTTSPPVTRTIRGVSMTRLALYGFLVILIALPVVLLLCLVHNRVREEEAEDAVGGSAEATA